MKPHKHAELIKAWADGAEIEQKTPHGVWENFDNEWTETWYEYRIKPEPKPAVTCYLDVTKDDIFYTDESGANIKITFDGETGKLKSAKVLK